MQVPVIVRFDDAADLSQAVRRISSLGHACLHVLAEIRTQLFASVLSDCLDAVGVMDQALPSRIRPLDEASVMVGAPAPRSSWKSIITRRAPIPTSWRSR